MKLTTTAAKTLALPPPCPRRDRTRTLATLGETDEATDTTTRE